MYKVRIKLDVSTGCSGIMVLKIRVDDWERNSMGWKEGMAWGCHTILIENSKLTEQVYYRNNKIYTQTQDCYYKWYDT